MVGLQYLICGYRWLFSCKAALSQLYYAWKCGDETKKKRKKKCPWGYFAQQNGSTLTKYSVIGQSKTASHRGDGENNNTLASEMDIPPPRNTKKAQHWRSFLQPLQLTSAKIITSTRSRLPERPSPTLQVVYPWPPRGSRFLSQARRLHSPQGPLVDPAAALI